jgi:elongation factor P
MGREHTRPAATAPPCAFACGEGGPARPDLAAAARPWHAGGMYGTSDLKRGLVVEFEGAPHLVESVSVSAPTARGASTITKVRLRNLRTKQKTDRSFRGGETFGEPDFRRRASQLLYRDGGLYHFMDQETFEQFHLPVEDLEWEAKFLRDEMEGILALWFGEELLGIELPANVVLRIEETPPPVKGGSATARTKPATLETGLVVHVPEYMQPGEEVQVDTRSGEFLGRA